MTCRISPATSQGADVFDFQFPVLGKCSRGMSVCGITVVKGAPCAPHHGWDGNTETPTVTPSINCEPRGCTFHGFVTAGKVTP